MKHTVLVRYCPECEKYEAIDLAKQKTAHKLCMNCLNTDVEVIIALTIPNEGKI